ncbi:GNAT family N-acetyltransferase [Pseudofrankia sp. DC12]|uniref:GNAT family N-acetyltransferase n=1 Tax=Pseudofrankia sp. DC12 TaxID=683315 RepID=UPI0005F87020|nr:GNAT family N-acetyltransferase [Pseudofrankia sp. DC12]
MGEPIVRDAAPGDLAEVRAIADEHEIRAGWPDGAPDFLDLERAAGRLMVAVAGDGVVEGFAGTLTRGTLTHLGDLFIAARAQSGGHGRRLLDAVLPPAGADVVTFASSDRRAQALYLRYGLVPGQPLWYLRGGPAARLGVGAELRAASSEEVAGLDAAASGGERARHLAWYAGLPGVAVWAGPGGYVFTRVEGVICHVGPAGGDDAAACTQIVLAAARLAAADRLTVSVAAFGAQPVARALVEAGYRIEDQDTLMVSRPGLFDLERYVPHTDLG